ncbi:hypothetical protein [Candidatus Accumulibacter sp. ACC005]|uniref:hypothetical protein n=1 Tax=Candidatus Accumulibacter sp. ACC005 TaxID=2823331 RepID=UPI0025BE68F6|nr:hypothetical protein [Candidatus Accumulibacter sp. ACC005]
MNRLVAFTNGLHRPIVAHSKAEIVPNPRPQAEAQPMTSEFGIVVIFALSSSESVAITTPTASSIVAGYCF